ncbi:MAG: putative DNA binding domain-containing protein [Armatimonadetes bacterium]|nr:putative DNA binding domain-containing protein [Armatimonadota bacterium]
MNISKIRQFAHEGNVSKETLKYLLNCYSECEHLDYKEKIELKSDHACASFGKDVVAMKNVGGGFIVVGVKDKTWEKVGIDSPMPYDSKKLIDQVRRSTGLDLVVDIIHHKVYIKEEELLFALILVRSTIKRTKLRNPSICSISFNAREKWGIRAGDRYIRKGESTVRIKTEAEMEELLDYLEMQYNQSDLEESNIEVSPFAVESGLYRLLPQGYERFIGRKDAKKKLIEAIEKDPRIWIYNLYGPGGVGKSALANWLVYNAYEKRQFESIIQLSAKERELSTTDCRVKSLTPSLLSVEDFLDNILRLFEHEEMCNSSLDKRKKTVIDIMDAYTMLCVLDNMESVSDARILDFVYNLPPSTKAKVLLTSRTRTPQWEYPIQLNEFSNLEIIEFIKFRNEELMIDFPSDKVSIDKLSTLTGGLPLAIQWTLGIYNKTKDIAIALNKKSQSSSPLLEFSFRNSWDILSTTAQKAMAVFSIFDNSPTIQLWSSTLDWAIETLEKAINELELATFINRRIDVKSSKEIYTALPITILFAKQQLSNMGNLEKNSIHRYNNYIGKLELFDFATRRYDGKFKKFDAKSDHQKKAILLSIQAEDEIQNMHLEAANKFYKEALDTDPRSIYTLVSYANFKVSNGRYTKALSLIQEAQKHVTKKNGFYIYHASFKIYKEMRDDNKRIECLRKALEFDPTYNVARHELGFSLSRIGKFDEAIKEFDCIIDFELTRSNGPTKQILFAMKTKYTTLVRAKRNSEAELFLNNALELIESYESIKGHKLELAELRSG